MEEIKRLSGIGDIVETAELLLACRGDYHKITDVIIENALKISGADRVCLIMRNRKDELIIKAGAPQYEHGIGKKISLEMGESFLRQVMNSESVVLVTLPSEDKRISYMWDLVRTHGISSVLFLPLFSESDPIGILVFDWIGGRKFSRDITDKIKVFGRLSSRAIGVEYKLRKDQEKLLQDEKIRILGEHSSQVAHIVRNSLMVIGGFSGRLLKHLSKYAGESGISNDFIETVYENAILIDNESKKLERIVNDVLNFTSIKKPVLDTYNINTFLEEEVFRMAVHGPKPILKLSKRLNGMTMTFDKNMLATCMSDLVRYANEASASRIVIKTKLKPKQKEIIISLLHNGKQVNPHIIEDIFSPFVTSEIDGSGLGLANVQSIIRSHAGNICVLNGDMTEFRITLPLIKA